MQRRGTQLRAWGNHLCSECGERFLAYRDRIFGKQPAVCSTYCQRARKTRLQRNRRAARRRYVASTGCSSIESAKSEATSLTEQGVSPCIDAP
jgi:hypothetical protein